MKINPKKLKCNSYIGDKLDLVPLIIVVISLFGIGIFYAAFRAGFTLAAFALALFSVTLIIGLLLYGIGWLFRRSAEKTAFNYIYQTVFPAAQKICQSDGAEIKLNLSITKEGIIFALYGGETKAVCDLSSAKRLPTASIMFIAVCLGVIAEEIERNASGGKIYKTVSYQVIINEDDTAEQFFVKDGELNTAAIADAKIRYKNNVKKYKRKNKR